LQTNLNSIKKPLVSPDCKHKGFSASTCCTVAASCHDLGGFLKSPRFLTEFRVDPLGSSAIFGQTTGEFQRFSVAFHEKPK